MVAQGVGESEPEGDPELEWLALEERETLTVALGESVCDLLRVPLSVVQALPLWERLAVGLCEGVTDTLTESVCVGLQLLLDECEPSSDGLWVTVNDGVPRAVALALSVPNPSEVNLGEGETEGEGVIVELPLGERE